MPHDESIPEGLGSMRGYIFSVIYLLNIIDSILDLDESISFMYKMELITSVLFND